MTTFNLSNIRDGDGQGGLACCDSWGRRVGHDWATELNWILEKETATHSSIFAWRIPRTEESGGPQSKGLQRVGHDWATNTIKLQLYKYYLLFLKSPLHKKNNLLITFLPLCSPRIIFRNTFGRRGRRKIKGEKASI